jgi:hypothetical protein
MTPKYVSFLRAEGLLGHENFAQIAHTLKQNVMAFMRKTNNLYLADYIQSVIVLLTPDVNLQCHIVVPQKEIINDYPLYLAYTSMSSGHYDATEQTDKNDETEIEADNLVLSQPETNSKKCRCLVVLTAKCLRQKNNFARQADVHALRLEYNAKFNALVSTVRTARQ